MLTKSLYRILIVLVVIFHLSIVTFLVLSIPLTLIRPAAGFWILAFIACMIGLWPICGGCWTTNLEKYLRKKAGLIVYQDTFIPFYLKKFFNVKITQKQVNMLSYAMAAVLAVLVISRWYYFR